MDRIDPATGKPVPRLYKLEETGYDGIVRKPEEVLVNELVSTYQERISQRIADYLKMPPAKQVIADREGKSATSIKRLLEELKVT